jgi:hypothetical protein
VFLVFTVNQAIAIDQIAQSMLLPMAMQLHELADSHFVLQTYEVSDEAVLNHTDSTSEFNVKRTQEQLRQMLGMVSTVVLFCKLLRENLLSYGCVTLQCLS